MNSRKLYLLIAFFISPLTLTHASQSSYGILGGVNMANIASQPDEAFTSRTALILGGYYEYRVSALVGLSSEFLLVGKGGKSALQDATLNINYFELPLLLKLHFSAGRFGLLAFAGPSIGFVTSSTLVDSVGGESPLQQLYPNEMGAQIGVGLEFPLTATMGFTFNLRYSTGLSDISSGASNYKNSGIYILGGLSFRSEEEDAATDTEKRAKEHLEKKYGSSEEETPLLPAQ